MGDDLYMMFRDLNVHIALTNILIEVGERREDVSLVEVNVLDAVDSIAPTDG